MKYESMRGIESKRLTLNTFANNSSMYKVVFLSWGTYPVPPADLPLDHYNSLVGGVVPEVFEGYSPREDREGY